MYIEFIVTKYSIIEFGGMLMKNKTPEQQAHENKEQLQKDNEKRIDALLEINNRYVRTERHLEQHANISDLDQLKHNIKLQEEREKEMENIKNIIVYGKHEEVDQKANLKKNIEYTEHYLQHHESNLDDETLQKTKEKQEHRKEQLKYLN